MTEKSKISGLVLSGGGQAGSWQLGALKRLLYDKQICYDVVSGTSVGSINGAGVAMFGRGEERLAYKLLEDLWLQISNKDVWKYRFPPYLSVLWSNSLYKTEPLKKFLGKHLDLERLKKSGKSLRIEAVSLTTGRAKVWTEKDNVLDALMASSAFPGLFESIEVDGEFYVDGGVRDVSPLSACIKAGATDIDVLLTSKGGMEKKQKKWKFQDVLSRCFEIAFDEIVENDLKLCQERNKNPNYKQINLRVLRPSVSLNGDLNFDSKIAKLQLEQGYKDAINAGW